MCHVSLSMRLYFDFQVCCLFPSMPGRRKVDDGYRSYEKIHNPEGKPSIQCIANHAYQQRMADKKGNAASCQHKLIIIHSKLFRYLHRLRREDIGTDIENHRMGRRRVKNLASLSVIVVEEAASSLNILSVIVVRGRGCLFFKYPCFLRETY